MEIKTEDLVVKGQTEGEWVALGRYHLSAGDKEYVTISSQNADGNVLADAVLFIPERN